MDTDQHRANSEHPFQDGPLHLLPAPGTETVLDTTFNVEWVAAERLFPNPANPRINDEAVPHVAASIRRFGWQQPIVAKRSGEVIAGHTRLKAAGELGHAQVPVVWFEGTDLDAAAFLIADNRTHTFSDWDDAALVGLLEELRREDALEGVGFDDQEIDRLLAELEAAGGEGESLEDPGPDDPPERPVTRRGDLWILGDHRLLCGDSTDAEDVARLMNGEEAALLATDPPYLVDYQGGNHPQSWHNRAEVKDKHWDDYVDPQSGVAFFTGWLAAALPHCREDVPVYQWHATRRQGLVEEAWKANGLLVHQTIIWAKARPVLTRCHFMWSHEPCFYGWPQGNMPKKPRLPDPAARTVWDVDQQGQQDGFHPTQKPVELFRRPMTWHMLRGEVCLEPFSGSGTQIICAEELGRRCYAIELAPPFVDVAIKRWQQATGKRAQLAETTQSFEEVAQERCVP